MYTLRAKHFGRWYDSSGETIESALLSLKLPIAKGGLVVIADNGKRKMEKILNSAFTTRLLGAKSKFSQEIASKQIKNLFGDF